MKVTIIAREYPPYIYGGAGVHVRYLAQELSKIMDVEIRCFGDQKVEQEHLKVIGYQQWERFNNKDYKFTPTLGTLSVDISMMQDKFDSDVVHTHTWYASFAGYTSHRATGGLSSRKTAAKSLSSSSPFSEICIARYSGTSSKCDCAVARRNSYAQWGSESQRSTRR